MMVDDGADGHVDIDVGAAVERIKEANILAVVADFIIKNDHIIELLAADAGATDSMAQHAGELVVGEHIQLLNLLPLHIHRAGISKDVDQPGLVDLHIHALGGQTDIAQQARQFAGGIGKITHLLDSELIEGLNASVDGWHG
jgi:hypothetical protein